MTRALRVAAANPSLASLVSFLPIRLWLATPRSAPRRCAADEFRDVRLLRAASSPCDAAFVFFLPHVNS